MKINHTPATAERYGRWPITQFPIIPAPCAAAQFPLPCPLHMLFITGNVSERSTCTTNKIPCHAVSCQVMLCLQPIHHTGTSCSMLTCTYWQWWMQWLLAVVVHVDVYIHIRRTYKLCTEELLYVLRSKGSTDIKKVHFYSNDQSLQSGNCLARPMVCTGPIFYRMIFVPLENTITCAESMGTPDDDHDNFCKKAVSSSSSSKSCRVRQLEPWNEWIVWRDRWHIRVPSFA